MPLYGTLAIPSCPYPGDNGFAAINAELSGQGAAATGAAGERIAIFQAQDGTPEYVSAEISFSGAPGAFTLQFQDADTDADAFYNSIGFNGATPGQITAVNAKFTARVELLTKAKFLRPLMVLQPANAVTCTVKLSR
jgi:hypothetical protein